MSEKKLNTAILGLDEEGLALLETACQTGYFQIQAVADTNTELANQIARKYDCAAYDDYRQLIVQSQLDVLFVAAPTHTCSEHIRAAMKKNFNILKLNPFARTFDEAAQFVQTANQQKVTFAVANLQRFEPALSHFREHLRQIPKEHIYLVTAICSCPERSRHDWHRDPKLAGGGVLLYGGYEIIDRIISNFSIPQKVYSLNVNQAPDKKQRLYLTEETAVITMEFTDRLIANIVASNTFGPAGQILKVYATDKILTLTNGALTVSNNQGTVLKRFKGKSTCETLTVKLLENFAKSLIWPDRNSLVSSAEDNLPNMAVIEAAYLSARTATPEEPARILQMAHKQPTSIWPP